MRIAARGRSITVLGLLLSGALALVSSTQPWFIVTRSDGGEAISVAGSDAVSLLAPLSLAVLALGAVIALVGTVLRWVFLAGAFAMGLFVALPTIGVLSEQPISAWGPKVTEATGLAGDAAVSTLVTEVSTTSWPLLALAACTLLTVTVIFGVLTARGWKTTGDRYRSSTRAAVSHKGPLDAVDSWDDLSRGTDPTR